MISKKRYDLQFPRKGRRHNYACMHKQNIVCKKTHFFPAVIFYPRHPTAKLESSVVGTRVGQQCFSGHMLASWPLNVVDPGLLSCFNLT